MFFFETGDEAIQRIGDRHVDLNQRGVDANAGAPIQIGVGRYLGGGLWTGRNGRLLVIRSCRRGASERARNRQDETQDTEPADA